MSEVTQILSRIENGDPGAAEKLLPVVYEELRRLAAAKLAHERPGQTLDATALVHEAYLQLVDASVAESQGQDRWNGRAHFFGAAAEAMRRILVNSAVRKRRAKHGGDRRRVELDSRLDGEVAASLDPGRLDLVALDEALNELAGIDPEAAEVVKLKYFAGLTGAEVAALLEISPRSVDRKWAYARAWLFQQLTNRDS